MSPPLPPRGSVLNRPPGRPNSTRATAPAPATSQGQAENKTDTFTYLTKIGPTQELYDGSRIWAQVTLNLEDAGPVAVGFKPSLTPVLGGKGILLETDTDRTFTIGKGNKLYIAATSVNRVKVIIEPIPWLEQISGVLNAVGNMLGQAVQKFIGGR